MDERGGISVVALWMAAAAAAIGLSAAHASRSRAARAAAAICEAHARFAVSGAALLAHSSRFADPEFEKTIDGCVLRARRRFIDDGATVILTCDVTAGRFNGTYSIGWTRVGAEWHPAWWAEP